MNPAIQQEIRLRVAAILNDPGHPLPVPSDVLRDIERDAPISLVAYSGLAFEMYLRGAIDALNDETARVRADTAAKIAVAEKERAHV